MIDYKTQQFEDIVSDLDVVFDASPLRDNNERLKFVKVLKDGGVLVSVNVDFPFNDEVTKALAEKNAEGELVANQPRQEWLKEITQLIDDGKVKIFISKVFPLEQVAEAHRESETWHVRGKLVLEVQKAN